MCDENPVSALLGALGVLALLIGCYLLGVMQGHNDAKESLHRDAVKAGVASFVVDSEGKVGFEWKK